MTTIGSGPDDTVPLTDEQVMRLLASELRRAALRELAGDSKMSLDELATAVTDSGYATLDEPGRVRRRLHHCHLPRMAAAGVVQYDSDTHCIDYLGDEVVETALAALEQ
jgi:DNA-binding transcriptional ArsR family regulator